MITFHFDAAKAIIADLLADEDPWWDGELETLTGSTRLEYLELAARLGDGFRTKPDRHMLNNAAAQLLGYPGISTSHCQNALGEDWQEIVSEFLDHNPTRHP